MLAGASVLAIECQQARIDFASADALPRPQAPIRSTRRWRSSRDAVARKAAVSVGLLGNAAELLPELARRARAGGPRPDLVTDQTSAHDLVNGYLPVGLERRALAVAQRAIAPRGGGRRRARVDRHARRGDARVPRDGRAHRRLRQQHPPGRVRRGRARTPSTFPASCRRTSGRCSAAARVRSAGSRCPAIPRTSTAPTAR